MKKIINSLLVIGLLILTTSGELSANNPVVDPKPAESYKPKAPTGEWVGDYEVKLLVFTWKSVICDKSTDDPCVKKNKVAAKTELIVKKPNGNYKKICEGVLLDYEVSPDGAEATYRFENEGYVSF